MQDQTILDARSCALEETEQQVLWLLLRPGRCGPWHGPWHAQELAREVGDPEQADLALSGLHAAGLAHLHGQFAHATRAAVRFYDLTVPMNE